MNDNDEGVSLLNIVLGVCLAIVTVAWVLAPWIFGEGF